ncbi:MAG TPA: BatA domain-containing protein [Tepidisphaeraceae bacterium]|jgi:hypothetical protein|nr:BatA domain-containing protein [Tepidisphaeraceae bacterium]
MFLNPLMLAGLGGAVLPLVLHLLSRARYRTITWGAMMFLEPLEAQQRQHTRLKQVILLLVRMAIVGLLALALARPIVHGTWGALAEEGRVSAVVILDRSASLAFEENGRPRMEMAKQAVSNILANLRRGDEVSLILMGGEKNDGGVVPSSDLRSLTSRLADLSPSSGKADIASALYQAMRIFNRDKSNNRELYLICDRQAASWQQINDEFASTWNKSRDSMDVPPRFFVVPIGSDERDNVLIEQVRPLTSPIIRDNPVDFEIRIRNIGTTGRPALPITLTANGREVFRTTVSLAPDSSSSVVAPVKLPTVGSQILSARITSAGYTADDSFDLAVDVIDPIPLLLISGDEREGAFRSESDYARLALAPFKTAGEKGPDPTAVTVLSSDQWPAEGLDKFRVVILANVARLSAARIKELEQFVYSGGGLFVSLGNLTRIEAYNTMLFRDHAGLLPALLSSPATSLPSEGTTLGSIQIDHPVFQFLKGRTDLIPTMAFARYCPTDLAGGTEARVIATFKTGDSFLIERSYGRGRVLLSTTTLDADWNTVPLTNFYLPLLQSSVRYLASGNATNRNLAPGDPIEAVFDDASDTKATLVRPDGASEVDLVRIGNRLEARFEDTREPGRYSLKVTTAAGERRVQFVVTTPREESDLTPLDDARWQWLQKTLRFTRIDPDREKLAGAIAGGRSGRELWVTMLAIVMALAIGELLLARLWTQEAVR